MAVIETKYSVGEKVWLAGTTTTSKQHPCPDCLGTRVWKGISTAGDEFTFGCPRCSTSYGPNDKMSLRYTAYVPAVRQMTVGSVRYDSHDRGAEYMCLETGVGSGNIWKESDLYHTESEAVDAAQLKCLAQNKTGWVAERFNKTLEISEYQLASAALEIAKEESRRASGMLSNLNDLFSGIENAEGDQDAIAELIADYRKRDWEADKTAAEQVAA